MFFSLRSIIMRFSFRNLLVLFVVALIGGAAGAGVLNASRPTVEARNIVFGDAAATGASDIPTYAGQRGVAVGPDVAGGAGIPFVGTVLFLEADDTAAYTGPTAAAALDSGTEACAVIGMTCHDVWTITKGADADITDAACTDNTLADDTENLVFCY